MLQNYQVVEVIRRMKVGTCKISISFIQPWMLNIVFTKSIWFSIRTWRPVRKFSMFIFFKRNHKFISEVLVDFFPPKNKWSIIIQLRTDLYYFTYLANELGSLLVKHPGTYSLQKTLKIFFFVTILLFNADVFYLEISYDYQISI